ncbi:hypothetical protein KSF73_03605 [Burkholderiaceae bacterium DAT-1]|nr:hypothetical protein [Burkholderiaceae bacterium DAT-1]
MNLTHTLPRLFLAIGMLVSFVHVQAEDTPAAVAGALQMLDDGALSDVTGQGGLSFAGHIVIGGGSVGNGQGANIVWGNFFGGKNFYAVTQGYAGTLDIATLSFDMKMLPDGSQQYVEIGLPVFMRMTDYGYTGFGISNEPSGNLTNNLGSVTINSTITMQGAVRFWAH